MKSWSHLEYYDTREFVTTLRHQEIRFVSKPGIANWDVITPAVALLADTVEASSGSRILLLGCGHGALGVTLARTIPNAEVILADTNFIAVTMAEKTLKLNAVYNARVNNDISVLPTCAGSFDVVVMLLPKGREIARRWLAESFLALRIGGNLYLAGANQEGIMSAISDMESLFGNSTTLAYRKSGRVSVATKEDQTSPSIDWTVEPGISPGTWYEFQAIVCGESFLLRSLPGIFSHDKVDDGTKLLLEKIDIAPGSNVLDVGCGYGIIGLLASRKGAGHVDLVDVDLLSLACVQENITLNRITNAEALKSDLLKAVSSRRYDAILTNPPFHVGAATDFKVANALMVHAQEVLEPRGSLVVVANKFLRYDRLMRSVFGNVHCLSETNRYHVLSSTRTMF